VVRIGSGDVNAYLHTATALMITAKDFRTWGGSVTAAEALVELVPPTSPTDAKRKILVAIDAAAARLNNTRAVARKSYVHPRVPETWVDGTLNDAFTRANEHDHLSHSESAVLGVVADPSLA
jgi:DNA topoisomerase-1